MKNSWRARVADTLIFLSLFATDVFAQSNEAPCGDSYENVSNGTPQKALGVCGLDGNGGGPEFSADYSQSSGLGLRIPMDFQIRSCTNFSCRYATQYNVRVQPDSGNSFSLYRTPDASIPILFSFEQIESSQSAPLTPGQFTNVPFNSKDNGLYSNVRLKFSLDMTAAQLAALEPGTYRGTFTFSIQQQPRYVTLVIIPVDFGSQSLGSMSFDITLDVIPNVGIFGLHDIPLEHNATDPYYARNTEDFCVFSQGGSRFSVIAESEYGNGNGGFRLRSSSTGDHIAYEVDLWEIDDPLGFEPLIEGNPSGHLWEGTILPTNCDSGRENMRLRISVRSSAVTSASSGTYQDTLQLTVTPE